YQIDSLSGPSCQPSRDNFGLIEGSLGQTEGMQRNRNNGFDWLNFIQPLERFAQQFIHPRGDLRICFQPYYAFAQRTLIGPASSRIEKSKISTKSASAFINFNVRREHSQQQPTFHACGLNRFDFAPADGASHSVAPRLNHCTANTTGNGIEDTYCGVQGPLD